MFYTPSERSTYEHADGRTFTTLFQRGFQFADDATSPFNNMQKTTSVSMVKSPDGQVIFESLFVQMQDSDGDQAFMFGTLNPPEEKNAVLRFVGGTGKFAGISGTYVTENLAGSWSDGSEMFGGTYHWEIVKE